MIITGEVKLPRFFMNKFARGTASICLIILKRIRLKLSIILDINLQLIIWNLEIIMRPFQNAYINEIAVFIIVQQIVKQCLALFPIAICFKGGAK